MPARKTHPEDSSIYPYIVILKIDKYPEPVTYYFKRKPSADNHADHMNCFRGFSAQVKFNPDYVAPEYGRLP